MHQVLDIPKEIVPSMRREFFKKYGTTLGGLMANYPIDPEDYLSFVHDIPVNDYIHRDEKLRNMLIGLPQSKWILTNSDKNHAKRVLSALGVEDLFTGILGVSDMDYHNKPDPYVFRKALLAAGNPTPKVCLFADDIAKNLIPAWEIGFVTVLVGNGQKTEAVMYQIPEIHDLSQVLTN
jgi:putative hydrolase of the HAD superfamily